LTAFLLDGCLGLFISRIVINKLPPEIVEFWALIEFNFFNIDQFVVWGFLLWAYFTSFLLAQIFVLILGRTLGELAVGRLAYASLGQRFIGIFKLAMTFCLPAVLFIPNWEHRRVSKLNILLCFLLILLLVLSPAAIWWSESNEELIGQARRLPVMEKINLDQNEYSSGQLIEMSSLGLEMLIPSAETYFAFPCPRPGLSWALPVLCIFDKKNKALSEIVLNQNGEMRSKIEFLRRAILHSQTLSGWYQKSVGKIFSLNNAEEKGQFIIEKAISFEANKGFEALINFGPFPEGAIEIQKAFYELLQNEKGPLNLWNWQKLSGDDYLITSSIMKDIKEKFMLTLIPTFVFDSKEIINQNSHLGWLVESNQQYDELSKGSYLSSIKLVTLTEDNLKIKLNQNPTDYFQLWDRAILGINSGEELSNFEEQHEIQFINLAKEVKAVLPPEVAKRILYQFASIEKARLQKINSTKKNGPEMKSHYLLELEKIFSEM